MTQLHDGRDGGSAESSAVPARYGADGEAAGEHGEELRIQCMRDKSPSPISDQSQYKTLNGLRLDTTPRKFTLAREDSLDQIRTPLVT